MCRPQADPHALEAALSVVAEPGDDPAQWLRALIEARDPGVVLESGQRPAQPGPSSHSSRQSPIMRRSPATVCSGKSRPRQLGAASPTVEAPQELVTAADGQHRRPACDRLPDATPFAARSGAISACSRSWPPPM